MAGRAGRSGVERGHCILPLSPPPPRHPPDTILFSCCWNRFSFVKLCCTASRQLPTLTTILQNPGGCECDSRGNICLPRERAAAREPRRRLGHQYHIKLSEYYAAAPEGGGGGGGPASWNKPSGSCEAEEVRDTSGLKILSQQRRPEPAALTRAASFAAFLFSSLVFLVSL